MPRIAILGWGSLIWDKRPEFDDKHDAWKDDGPELQLEFSRISETRLNALTLVIDPTHGEVKDDLARIAARREELEALLATTKAGHPASGHGRALPAAGGRPRESP